MVRKISAFYFPLLAFMTGLSCLAICSCLGSPSTTGETGPTGSDALCFWYFMPHIFLWLLVGVVSLFLLPSRVATPFAQSPSQQIQAIFGSVGGCVFAAIAVGVAPTFSDFAGVLRFAMVINLVPFTLFMMVGAFVFTTRKVSSDRNEPASHDAKADYFPSLK